MAVLQVAVNSVSAGGSLTTTVPLASFSGTSVVICVAFSAQDTFDPFSISATWKGTPMNVAVSASGALAGFGQGTAWIAYLAIGTVSGESGDVVVTTTGPTGIGTVCTVSAVEGVDQVTPLNGTDTSVFTSSGNTASTNVSTNPGDLVFGCMTFDQSAAAGDAVATTGQTKQGALSSTFGTIMSGCNGIGVAPAGSNYTMTFNSFLSAYAFAQASFNQSLVPSPPVISNVDGGSFADPNAINIPVNGQDLAPVGTTSLYYADSSDFGTANKQIQLISGVTNTNLTWGSINVGSVGEGDNFLFVVTDEGGGSEAVSPAFPILVADPEAFAQRFLYVTDGTLGPVLVAPVSFDPKAAFIRATSSTVLNTIQSDAVLSMCFVDELTSMGNSVGSDSAGNNQREQAIGAGSLFIHDGGAGPHLVEGTPTIGPTGLTIDFTINTPGHLLVITVFGGSSVKASVDQFDINDGDVSGLAFRPDVLIATTLGIPGTSPGDSTFAVLSYGICIDTGTPQQWSAAIDQSGTTRNCNLKDGTILGQLQGTGYTWEMAITSFNADGYSWSGANADGGFGLALRLPGRQIYVDTFDKTSDSTPGVTQLLPDLGFEPGSISLSTAGRSGTIPAVALGSRFSLGFASADGQDVTAAWSLPDTGAPTAEQVTSDEDVVAVTSVPGTITVKGRLIDFAQIPTIEWVNNSVGSNIKIGIVAIDAADTDEDLDIIEEVFF